MTKKKENENEDDQITVYVQRKLEKKFEKKKSRAEKQCIRILLETQKKCHQNRWI